MMSFIIREGQEKDVQAVLNLIIELAVFEKEPVAEENSVVIGIALFYERYSTWKGKTIHLEDLMVTQNKRKIGAGKALYTAVLKYAHAHDFNRVAWEVIDWNLNAINFYKSTGATYLNDWSVIQMNKENLDKFIQNN
jgi:GNAT superfamily N-acetyltransferase